MKHVPADVMLNAAPDGVNGSPLYSVHRFKGLTNTANSNVVIDTQKAFFTRAWLAKAEGTTTGSAFDHTPIQPNHIMFRPLKMEAYTQFGSASINKALEHVNDTTQDATRTNWDVFTAEAHKSQLDSKRPVSHTVDARESNHFDAKLWNWEKSDGSPLSASPSEYGLRWGGQLSVSDKNRYGGYPNLHARQYWNSDYGLLQWARQQPFNDSQSGWGKGDSNQGGGAAAFGVITTSTTISANDAITFSTTNLYGMGFELIHTPGTAFFDPRNQQSASWGQSFLSNTYRQKNIVDLSVKVFHNHPKEQTLFDPRTFAVHHFNPAVEYLDGIYMNPSTGATGVIDLYYTKDGTEEPFVDSRGWYRNAEIKEFSSFRDAQNETFEFKYFLPIPSATTDFVEPSRYVHHTDNSYNDFHDQDGEYYSNRLSDGTIVLGDVTQDSAGGSSKPPVMDDQYWYMNTNRTGKLLPFRYYKRTITLPFDVGESPTLVDLAPTDEVLAGHASVVQAAIFVGADGEGRGTGFGTGDIVGNEAYGVSFTVTASNGQITALTCIDPGADISASVFASSTDKAAEAGGLKLKIIASTTGSDLECYFLSGAVQQLIYTDAKPLIVKNGGADISRIAGNLAAPTSGDGSSSEFEPNSHEDGPGGIELIIASDAQSTNRQYDAFFHFHNDISFNWLAGGTGGRFHTDAFNVAECSEQHVTLDITAT
jgi:hypothetical protein